MKKNFLFYHSQVAFGIVFALLVLVSSYLRILPLTETKEEDKGTESNSKKMNHEVVQLVALYISISPVSPETETYLFRKINYRYPKVDEKSISAHTGIKIHNAVLVLLRKIIPCNAP